MDPIAYLREQRGALVARLCELVRIPSISTDPARAADGRRAAGFLIDYLGSLGLAAELAETAGRPAVIASAPAADAAAPTVLIYGHYDVQPPEPLEAWLCDPFAGEVRDRDATGRPIDGGVLIARGAADNKGQLMAMLAGVEAHVRAVGRPPVHVKLLIEGEEEVGSPNLAALLAERRDELAADAVLLADAETIRPGVPTIVYSTRGLVYATVTVRGPAQDLHSGLFGGMVANPANGLARLVAGLHDATGRVTLDGFYDGVAETSDAQRAELAALGVDENAITAKVGVESLGGGEAGRGPLERGWLRPTCDVNGLYGGYQGPGSKTIIPAAAGAKVSFRLVGNQDPAAVAGAFERYVRANYPAGLTADVAFHAHARPYQADRSAPAFAAVADAVRATTGCEPDWVGGGGTLPVLADIKRLLGIDSVLLGLARPDCHPHGPNEQMNVADFLAGAETCARTLTNLASGAGA